MRLLMTVERDLENQIRVDVSDEAERAGAWAKGPTVSLATTAALAAYGVEAKLPHNVVPS